VPAPKKIPPPTGFVGAAPPCPPPKKGVAHLWNDTVVGVAPPCLPYTDFGATTGGLPRLFIP